MAVPIVLVDGYNVLLALAAREGFLPDERGMPEARSKLSGLLAEWGAARGFIVVVAWDGAARPPSARPADQPGVRQVFLTPPAEADDWIVEEARRLTGAGREALVATRDQGLLSRLARLARPIDLKELAADLDALVQGPISAPHIGGAAPGERPPASEGPVDTGRLPRRRGAGRREPEPGSPPPLTRSAAHSEIDAEARAAAALRKQQRRHRFQRASARRKKTPKP